MITSFISFIFVSKIKGNVEVVLHKIIAGKMNRKKRVLRFDQFFILFNFIALLVDFR